jgi:hypothetical protein
MESNDPTHPFPGDEHAPPDTHRGNVGGGDPFGSAGTTQLPIALLGILALLWLLKTLWG